MFFQKIGTEVFIVRLGDEHLVVVAELARELPGASPSVGDWVHGLADPEVGLERPHLAEVGLDSSPDSRDLNRSPREEDVADELLLDFGRKLLQDELERFRNSGLIMADDGGLQKWNTENL